MIKSYYWDYHVLNWNENFNSAMRSNLTNFVQPWSGQESPPALTPPSSDDQNSQDGSNGQTTKYKTPVTAYQAEILQKSYNICSYPSKEVRIDLALKLNLSEKKVTIWFQNRRAKQNRKDKMKKRPGRKPLANLPNLTELDSSIRAKSDSSNSSEDWALSFKKSESPDRFSEDCFLRRISTPVLNSKQPEQIIIDSRHSDCSNVKSVLKQAISVSRPKSSFRINEILGLTND